MAKTDKVKLRQAIKNQKESRNTSISFDNKYRLIRSKNGKIRDILFLFGSWVGHRLSDIMQDPQGQNYIFNYILNPENNFPTDFKRAVFDIAKSLEAEDDHISSKEENDIPY
jgi:hypothetical protein